MSDEPNYVTQAFELAAKNCGGKPRMLAALDISSTWMYECCKQNKVGLQIGLKLQVLTRAEFKWQQMCPADYEAINKVSEYLI